jgi:hypothetical protein
MTRPDNWIKVLRTLGACTLVFMIGASALPQHQGHDMSKRPGLNKSKAKSKAKAPLRKKRKVRRKKPQTHIHKPGMLMPHASPSAQTHTHTPGMQMPQVSPSPSAQTHTHTPGMQMPRASASSSPSPSAQTHTHTPGMQMPPTSPSPSPSAQTHTHTPGMQMPTSATPSASPAKMDPSMHMPAPGASPSPGAPGHQMENMPGMGSEAMNMGPLLVMNGNDMGIRVGSSEKNTLSMGAMGSGTTWQPSSGPMHMHYKQSGDWLLMFHYNLVAGVNRQGGPRGVTRAESANWFMPMAYHKLGKGTVQLRSMFSFEPFTFPPGGSPLLFQTGETYKGQPLIDRQHPHDFFMELSAQYTLPLGERGTWFTYFGYPGEPALGPVAFMHRLSASENPSATLAHHLQDSTHISFGVLTTGFTYRWLKLEGSIFNGREPDENRYNFDVHKWNSRSARLSIMPNPNWTMQASYGFLRSPEGQEPDTDIRRVTASVQYNKPFHRGNWASALIWGRNHTSTPHEVHTLNGYTFESTVNFQDQNHLYTRMELVDKNELLRAGDRALLKITDDHPSFRIGAATFGGARDLWNTDKISVAVGSDLTFYSKPAILDRIYGANPVSWKLFFRIRPGKMDMSGMQGMHGNKAEKATREPFQIDLEF